MSTHQKQQHAKAQRHRLTRPHLRQPLAVQLVDLEALYEQNAAVKSLLQELDIMLGQTPHHVRIKGAPSRRQVLQLGSTAHPYQQPYPTAPYRQPSEDAMSAALQALGGLVSVPPPVVHTATPAAQQAQPTQQPRPQSQPQPLRVQQRRARLRRRRTGLSSVMPTALAAQLPLTAKQCDQLGDYLLILIGGAVLRLAVKVLVMVSSGSVAVTFALQAVLVLPAVGAFYLAFFAPKPAPRLTVRLLLVSVGAIVGAKVL